MNREEIKNKVVNLIFEQLKIPKEEIVEESTFESLGADSLDRVELVMRFEDNFDIEIDDEQAEKLQNLGQVINYIIEKIK